MYLTWNVLDGLKGYFDVSNIFQDTTGDLTSFLNLHSC